MNTGHPTTTARPLLAVLLLLTVPLLVGAAIAPPVFNGLRALGEITDALPKLTEARFERVASRCVMIMAVLMLYPVIRMTGLWPDVRRGLVRSPARRCDLWTGVYAGAVSILVVYCAGWALGAYAISPKVDGWGEAAGRLAVFSLGALFIGYFEEIFFRGFIFGAVRVRLGFAVALVFSSVFFSAIHFFRPLYPETIEHAAWYSGFAIIPHLFDRFVWPRDLYFAATLLVMGLTLATYYHKRGNLYLIIGLHAGWVVALQSGAYFLDRNRDVLPLWFGHGDLVSKGLLAVLVVAGFWIHALRMRHAPDDPDARGADR